MLARQYREEPLVFKTDDIRHFRKGPAKQLRNVAAAAVR